MVQKTLVYLTLALVLPFSKGFPIDTLTITSSQAAQLNQSGPSSAGSRDVLATSLILPKLQDFFKAATARIKVEPGDIVIQQTFPDTTIDDSCSHNVEALNGHAKGDIKNSSYLEGGIQVSWKGVSVFVDAELDAVLDIGGDVRVRIGKHILGHHCTHLGRKTMGLNIVSDGKNGVGINMTASDAHLEHANGTWYLAFNFHADVVGRVINWNVDKITADGCKIKILGIQIASVCGYVERKVKDKVQVLLDKVTKVDAPKILQRLQEKINTAIGSTVRIPLKWPLLDAVPSGDIVI
mmetsp:Transcript_145279/g.264344  ORF Transcript_145279/g.264344 Transcript_145279/m.264344 type:complete len:295 (+) Transcript_145279:54-938(+)